MKKTLLFLLIICIAAACSSRRTPSSKRGGSKFSTYYNTLFNSKDALETEERNRIKNHKDDYYAPFIHILKTEEQTAASALGNNIDRVVPGARPRPQQPGANDDKTATVLEISEAKALKAIAKYSKLQRGNERNSMMFDAHILLAQSRLYQDKPVEALDALSYLFRNMSQDKRLPLARIYEAQAYTKLKDYHKANEIFLLLSKDPKLKKEYRQLLSIYYAEMLLQAGRKDDALEQLDLAAELNSKRSLQGRIHYLRGQVLASEGEGKAAREAFAQAYKYGGDFEFEVKAQVQIAKTFNAKNDDYSGAKKYLEDISKKGTYASRINEFDYALGLMANKAGKTKEAEAYFRKSISAEMSDPQIRGLSYYEIGKQYFVKDDYLRAGAFYDSALAVMTHEPSKVELAGLSANIKELSRNYYLIKKNDSILRLVAMPAAEREAFFNKHIANLKAEEEKRLAEEQRAARNADFDTGDYSTTSASLLGGGRGAGLSIPGAAGSGKFYFANQAAIAKGEADFKNIWGNRSLGDNWRYSAKRTSISDLQKEALGISTAPDPRRFELSFYTDQLPKDATKLAAMKKERDTAELGLGRMYERFFGNTPLATKTLFHLVDEKQPDEDTRLQALYEIFTLNMDKQPQQAERAKKMILDEFPYTAYAEFVRNPRNAEFAKFDTDVEKIYQKAFALYEDDKHEESSELIERAIKDHPSDALVPKFYLLWAFNTGKTAGKEVMILQLEQIALNYPKTNEGIRAKEMLQYLKSELQMEMTDESGNKITTPGTATAPINESPADDSATMPVGPPTRMRPLDNNQKVKDQQNLKNEAPNQLPSIDSRRRATESVIR